MHLTSFILTHCVLTLGPPLMTVSSFPVCYCAVTSIISSKKCFLDVCFFFCFFFASCSLRRLCHSSPGAGWLCGLRLLEGSPWIRSKVATEACFKTNGWANEPLKAPLICPMALLEKPRWGSCSGRERLRYGCGVCGGCPSCGVIGWSRRGSQHDVGWSKWVYGRASSSLRLHLPGHWGVWAKC